MCACITFVPFTLKQQVCTSFFAIIHLYLLQTLCIICIILLMVYTFISFSFHIIIVKHACSVFSLLVMLLLYWYVINTSI